MKARLSKVLSSNYFRLGLGLLISSLTLYLAFKNVSLGDVWSTLTSAVPGFLILALASVAINTLAKTIRWKVLIGPAGKEISLFYYLASLLVGQMLNMLLPARVGDLSRAYDIGGMGPGRVYVLGSVVIEKVLDMICYALLFLALLVMIPLPGWIGDSGYTFAIATILVLVGLILVTVQQRWINDRFDLLAHRLPDKVKKFTAGHFRSALSSLDVLRRRNDLLRLVFWSAITWGFAVLTNQLVLLAMDLHLPLSASILILIGLQAGISLPSIPGRVGVFEYICVLALGFYQVDPAQALSYGIILHIIVVFPTTLLGVLLFWLMGYSQKRTRPSYY